MLPDFPEIKQKIAERLNQYFVQAEKQYSGFISEIPQKKIMEGKSSKLVRENGQLVDNKTKELSVKIEIPKHKFENLNPTEILELINDAAKQMSDQKSIMVFDGIKNAVEEVGNNIDLKGKQFKIQDFFKMLETIWVEFDSEGKAYFPTLVINPATADSINKEMKKLEDDHDTQKQFNEIIGKKRLEWNERENNRKLVG